MFISTSVCHNIILSLGTHFECPQGKKIDIHLVISIPGCKENFTHTRSRVIMAPGGITQFCRVVCRHIGNNARKGLVSPAESWTAEGEKEGPGQSSPKLAKRVFFYQPFPLFETTVGPFSLQCITTQLLAGSPYHYLSHNLCCPSLHFNSIVMMICCKLHNIVHLFRGSVMI